MDKKPKIDLSNVGGRPKDWLERASDPYSGSYGPAVSFWGLLLLFVLCVVGFFASLLFF